MRIIFIIISTCIVVQAGFSAEIDSITPRNVTLDNSISVINEIFNRRILQGIENANAQQNNYEDYAEDEFCDEEVLYEELRKAIFQSSWVSWGLKGYELDKQLRLLLVKQSYSLALNDSIYRDIDFLEGVSLNLKELSDVVNINGHLIGLDKLGHFFAEGWKYFELTRYDGNNMETALAWGKQQEKGKFGYTTTGIFSYADLVANFNGWRFWNQVLLKEKDPLKGIIANLFDAPYISCDIQYMASIEYEKIVKAWEYNNHFDLSDYIDGTWDEGNNCNSFKTPMIEEKVNLRIKNITPDYSCPLEPEHCSEAQNKYDYYAKYVLHPYCLIATDDFF